MALLQVITGTACNNKTGWIGQPTYAENVIHETSAKRKKTRINNAVNKSRVCANLLWQHPKLFRKSARNGRRLRVLSESRILSHVFLSTLTLHTDNVKHLYRGASLKPSIKQRPCKLPQGQSPNAAAGSGGNRYSQLAGCSPYRRMI